MKDAKERASDLMLRLMIASQENRDTEYGIALIEADRAEVLAEAAERARTWFIQVYPGDAYSEALQADLISALSSSGQGERDIDDACMWYRHDFGLLSEAEKEHLRFEARDWQRALSKAKPAAPAPEKGEARRPSRDWQIAQLLEATCLIKSEAALMREGTSRELTTTAVEAAIGYLRRLLDVTAPARPAEQREEP